MIAAILKLGRVIYEAASLLVRAASPTAFTAEVVTVIANVGEADWATWRRFGLGWRFWASLGQWSGLVAIGCLIACLLMAAARMSCPDEDLTDTGWCLWFNVATIILLLFLRALAPG